VIRVLLAGLIAGWLTGKLMHGRGYGILADILLGDAALHLFEHMTALVCHFYQEFSHGLSTARKSRSLSKSSILRVLCPDFHRMWGSLYYCAKWGLISLILWFFSD